MHSLPALGSTVARPRGLQGCRCPFFATWLAALATAGPQVVSVASLAFLGIVSLALASSARLELVSMFALGVAEPALARPNAVQQ